jgi:hypothetical protein
MSSALRQTKFLTWFLGVLSNVSQDDDDYDDDDDDDYEDAAKFNYV